MTYCASNFKTLKLPYTCNIYNIPADYIYAESCIYLCAHLNHNILVNILEQHD